MGKPKGESRGLKYLSSVRPDAMEHLLKFFGESGRHLEPKTRFLISIVTKVINFSPRGLEQYVRRAINEGAKPDEVIDAVLCSYPCAGLTRVVDAIDVILDMGLPGFEAPGAASESPASASTEASRAVPAGRWVQVAQVGEIQPGAALHVQAGAHQIALFNVQGKILAIDHLCPHKHGPLSNGVVACGEDAVARGEGVSAAVVSCPLHGWKFDLLTGESVNHPGARVRTYSVRSSEASGVEVLIPA